MLRKKGERNMKATTRTSRFLALVLAILLSLGMVAPAMAEPVVNQTTGSITIHKYLLADGTTPDVPGTGQTGDEASKPAGSTPLSGIPFTITQVDTVVNGSILKSYEGVNYYAKSGGAVVSGNTDVDGILASGTIPVGIYLVTEGASSKVSNPVAPFLVQVPTTVQNTGGDDTLLYDVNVYPKNSSALEIGKVAVPEGGSVTDDATLDLPVAIGDTVDYYITADVPADVNAAGVTYALWDEYPTGLDFKAGSVVVKAGSSPSFATPLTAGDDYTIGLTETSPGVNGGGKLTVTLTSAGRAKVAGLEKIQLKLSALILPSIPLGQAVDNHATIDYTDKNGDNKKIETEPGVTEPEVHTGGYSLIKTDLNGGAKLAGATFKLVKRTSENVADYQSDFQTYGYYQKPHTSVDATAVSAAGTGYAAFVGIPFGAAGDDITAASSDFWLVEVNAPSGYRLLGAPIKITIDKDSYNASTGVTITNSKGFEFPLTGGIGTTVFVVAGIVLVGLSGLVIIVARRRAQRTHVSA
jgi:fimbrial isopeptide formation D2 family protein/LPXTG-motif cell wall-anchored protein